MLAIAGLFTSCELTEDNPHGGDATLSSFQTWKGLQAYSYSTLNDQLYSASDWMFASEGGTDLWQAKSNGDGYRSDLNYENFSTSNNSTNKLWKQCYAMITNCNSVINEADKILEGKPEEIKVLVAETKVLRAFYNYLLVANFGPVTLTTTSNPSVSGVIDFTPKRSSEKAFYDCIINDLKEAANDLGVTPFEGNRARVTKKTALGLLAKVYAQRAGLKKYGDSETYWKLAAQTAEDLITNAASYGAHLYTDIADMWADANNRTNREALFIAAGPSATSDAYPLSTKANKLLAYSCGGLFTDLFSSKHNPTKNGQCYYYGRYNAQAWMPSYYLMYCFNPEWDRRWEYSFIYAYGDYSMVQCGWAAYDTGQRKLDETLCENYAINKSHVGETIYPLADCDGIATDFGGNQYPAKIWPKGETSGDASKLLTVAPSSAEIGQPGYFESTKAYAIPYPIANDDNRVNTVYVHERPSDEDLASRRYMTVVLSDLYDPDTKIVYGNEANGSSAVYAPNIGNGRTASGACPSLNKFNWSFTGAFVGNNLQMKTGDMFIMRMAEIYLLAAEAEQMLGNGSKAADYLNVLRQRAARPGTAESTWKLATATEDDIFDEYAREMCGEFNRWFLLKRHNAFESRLAKYNPRAAKAFKPYMYNRPVSADFLQQILNDEEYGDNGYGQTASSGLDNVDQN